MDTHYTMWYQPLHDDPPHLWGWICHTLLRLVEIGSEAHCTPGHGNYRKKNLLLFVLVSDTVGKHEHLWSKISTPKLAQERVDSCSKPSQPVLLQNDGKLDFFYEILLFFCQPAAFPSGWRGGGELGSRPHCELHWTRWGNRPPPGRTIVDFSILVLGQTSEQSGSNLCSTSAQQSDLPGSKYNLVE